MGRRVLITGLATFWGGLVAKRLEADPTIDVLIGLDTREPEVELERTEYVRTDENYSILARIVKAARIDTIVHTFLVVDSAQMRPRLMHEINVIGTMNLFAAASAIGQHGARRRRQVVRLRVRLAKEDPVWFREETPRSGRPHTRVEQTLEVGRGLRPRLRRGQPPRQRHVAAILERARTRHRHLDQQGARASRRTVHLRFRPTAAVRARGRRDPLDPVRARPSPARHLQRGRRRAVAVVRGGEDLREAHRPAPARSARRSPRCRCDVSACSSPTSCSSSCVTAGAWTTGGSKRAGFAYRYTSAGTVEAFVEASATATHGRRHRARLPLRARRRAVLPSLTRRSSATAKEADRRCPSSTSTSTITSPRSPSTTPSAAMP